MDRLPNEILVDILDCKQDHDTTLTNFINTSADLDPTDVISSQRISPRLSKLARDNSLWRYKCFEKAPSASTNRADKPHALASLTGALGSLSISSPAQGESTQRDDHHEVEGRHIKSKRAQAVADWDCTDPRERIDWYSEYIGRNAAISAAWLDNGTSELSEIRGLAIYADGTKAVGPLEDGSVCIWDISERSGNYRRAFKELGRSSVSSLFTDLSKTAETSTRKTNLSFGGVVEVVTVDSKRDRAYIAVENLLNEVDLTTMTVLSQSRFAWPLTALSQENALDVPLTVGTTWSLHLYDPRVQLRDRSRSPEDLLRAVPADPEESIAFLPNYMKGAGMPDTKANLALTTAPAPTISQLANSLRQPRTGRRSDLSDYARIEPGPLSIVHHSKNDILIAGRFPSILSYDRRYFPRLQYVAHSGARLSSLAVIPFPPHGAMDVNPDTQGTLLACGEYGGRGSLELYSLPHTRLNGKCPSTDFGLPDDSHNLGATDREHALLRSDMESDHLYSYKNRQEASSSKLLSVAAQGTRIVFSDAEGGIKWVERDGRGLARRWNINAFQINQRGGSVVGEQVARKILPLPVADSDRGARGDGDLLVWTGEKIAIITNKPDLTDHDKLVQAFEQKMDLNEKNERDREEEYSQAMRKALERQADERRWMATFRLRSRNS